METLDFSPEEEQIIANAIHWLLNTEHLYSIVFRLCEGDPSLALILSEEILRRFGFSPTDATDILYASLSETRKIQ